MEQTIQAVSFGGGVQSTAMLVLAAQGDLDIKHFFFANVGEDSENPDTITFVHDIAMPFRERHGITLEEVRPTIRGEDVTLMGEIERREKSYVIPIHYAKSGMARRRCTYDMKIVPIARRLRQMGATKGNKARLALGISMDEMQRMRTSSGFDYYDTFYPLIERRLYRDSCESIIRDAGLPVPPKSSCFFCPFHNARGWSQLRSEKPELFEESAQLEDRLSERMMNLQGVPVFLSSKRKPLREAFPMNDQLPLFDEPEDACESGFCMT